MTLPTKTIEGSPSSSPPLPSSLHLLTSMQLCVTTTSLPLSSRRSSAAALETAVRTQGHLRAYLSSGLRGRGSDLAIIEWCVSTEGIPVPPLDIIALMKPIVEVTPWACITSTAFLLPKRAILATARGSAVTPPTLITDLIL